jgi:hypothetical protein
MGTMGTSTSILKASLATELTQQIPISLSSDSSDGHFAISARSWCVLFFLMRLGCCERRAVSCIAAGSGYRCLRVMKNSPAQKAGLVSFFDFIVAVNDIPLQQHDETFASLISAHQG